MLYAAARSREAKAPARLWIRMQALKNLLFWMPWPPPPWVLILALAVVGIAAAMLVF